MYLVVTEVGHHSITIGFGSANLRCILSFIPLGARTPLRPLCLHRRNGCSPCILLSGAWQIVFLETPLLYIRLENFCMDFPKYTVTFLL